MQKNNSRKSRSHVHPSSSTALISSGATPVSSKAAMAPVARPPPSGQGLRSLVSCCCLYVLMLEMLKQTQEIQKRQGPTCSQAKLGRQHRLAWLRQAAQRAAGSAVQLACAQG